MGFKLLRRAVFALVIYVLERRNKETAETDQNGNLRNVVLKALVQIILAGNEPWKLTHVKVHGARPVVDRAQPEREEGNPINFLGLYELHNLRGEGQERAHDEHDSQKYRY